MCGAPVQGQTLPAGVDVEKETVITGRVLAADGQPVGGAFVRLLDGTGEFTAEVVASGTGDFRFFAAAEERAKETSARNIPVLPGLPIPEDTANLRLGPDLNPGMLALLPLVGVWRGEGEANNPTDGEYRFGQQIVVSHDGGNYLHWDSQTWVLDADGEYVRPDLRESGYWRVAGDGIPGSIDEETVELLLTHSSGVVELYYGQALTQSSWELATDVVIRSKQGALVGGAKRLYGIIEGGDLAYVEERILADGPLKPHLSARLSRYIG